MGEIRQKYSDCLTAGPSAAHVVGFVSGDSINNQQISPHSAPTRGHEGHDEYTQQWRCLKLHLTVDIIYLPAQVSARSNSEHYL